MEFELSIWIGRPPQVVFAFLRDKHQFRQEEGSPVMLIEKTTPGPIRVGSRFREVVQMLPFYRGEIRSTITSIECDERLEENFEGAGMVGHLAYHFLPAREGTELVQRESLQCRGLLRLCQPAMRIMLERRLYERLLGIKELLERERFTPD